MKLMMETICLMQNWQKNMKITEKSRKRSRVIRKYTRKICDDGRNMYSGKPGICSEKYCRNLPEKGDIDSAIQTLEGAFSDTESEDICIELIGILKEHQKLQKARQYAIQLKQRMDPAPENAYV